MNICHVCSLMIRNKLRIGNCGKNIKKYNNAMIAYIRTPYAAQRMQGSFSMFLFFFFFVFVCQGATKKSSEIYLLQHYKIQTGWLLYSLLYHTDGLTARINLRYLCLSLFSFLQFSFIDINMSIARPRLAFTKKPKYVSTVSRGKRTKKLHVTVYRLF